MQKTIFLYCSNVDANTPPSFLFDTAKKISQTHKIIFIELNSSFQVKQSFSFLQIFKLTKKLTSKNKLLIWNFNFYLSKSLLGLYTFFLKKIFNCKIVLIATTPTHEKVYNYFFFDRIIYDCTDQFKDKKFVDNEKNLKKFDKIHVKSHKHLNEIKKHSSYLFLGSAGYFSHELVANLKINHNKKIKNSVVFFGGISNRLDFYLLKKIIAKIDNFSFYFIGDIYLNKYYITKEDSNNIKQWNEILKFNNVHYLGKIERSFQTNILSLFEIGIIPYRTDDFMNLNSHPIKFYDYLLAGLPVISTRLPILEEHAEKAPILFFDQKEEINKLVEKAQKIKIEDYRSTIKSMAEIHTFERKAAEIISISKASSPDF